MSNNKKVGFEYEDDVNLFYCDRCNQFLITEYNDTHERECVCSNEHGKGTMKLLLKLDDFMLRRGLQDTLNQLNDLIAFRNTISTMDCSGCRGCEDEPEGYKN